mmetsp:Transcript_1456/g.3018  ORF Transcript_1456/g.3018 Transcript_1456/m.3018 type:complete len:287 (-) Transcript_1456:996-1856(-)
MQVGWNSSILISAEIALSVAYWFSSDRQFGADTTAPSGASTPSPPARTKMSPLYCAHEPMPNAAAWRTSASSSVAYICIAGSTRSAYATPSGPPCSIRSQNTHSATRRSSGGLSAASIFANVCTSAGMPIFVPADSNATITTDPPTRSSDSITSAMRSRSSSSFMPSTSAPFFSSSSQSWSCACSLRSAFRSSRSRKTSATTNTERCSISFISRITGPAASTTSRSASTITTVTSTSGSFTIASSICGYINETSCFTWLIAPSPCAATHLTRSGQHAAADERHSSW